MNLIGYDSPLCNLYIYNLYKMHTEYNIYLSYQLTKKKIKLVIN